MLKLKLQPWPPDVKNWLTGEDPDAGKDWKQEEKGTTEDEIVGWHHWLNGHEFEQVLGVGGRQGRLACCSPWGCKELDTTEWLNWTFLKEIMLVFFSSALRGVTGNGWETALLYSLPLNHTNLRLHMGSANNWEILLISRSLRIQNWGQSWACGKS